MATSDEPTQTWISGNTSDLFVQFRWFLALLTATLFLFVLAVALDSILGKSVVAGLLAAFALLNGSIVVVVGIALFTYRVFF